MTTLPCRRSRPQKIAVLFLAFTALTVLPERTLRAEPALPEIGDRLIKAYPDQLARAEENALIWRDGTEMPLDDGVSEKPPAQWLEQPDIADMFRYPYPAGEDPRAPPENADPGRARARAFFDKMYGDCQGGGVASHLVEITWLPKRAAQRLRVSRINGVAGRLEAVSAALDALPASFNRFLESPASTFICRAVAGTARISAHGYGIAIDIAVPLTDYWRWPLPAPGTAPAWKNRIPHEIVDIFERHGFIWGGRWHHFDTMHFEYRPELITIPQPGPVK